MATGPRIRKFEFLNSRGEATLPHLLVVLVAALLVFTVVGLLLAYMVGFITEAIASLGTLGAGL
jgi:hypothetical protein